MDAADLTAPPAATAPATLDPAAAASPPDLARRFGGVARVYGAAAAARIAAARVAVVGLGGVGSWAAEALVRSGCADLLLVDLDHVGESNTNRQLHALDGAYGLAKVDAMARRLQAIHPAARLQPVDDFVTPANVAHLLADADLVLDCTDQPVAKAAMAAWARAQGRVLVMSGAGGGRTDPTRIRAGDLAHAVGDPLLASVRHRLRKVHGFPAAPAPGRRAAAFGVAAVWSDEPVRTPWEEGAEARQGLPPEGLAQHGMPQDGMAQRRAQVEAGRPAGDAAAPAGLSCAGYGSVVTVTASIGMAMVAVALARLAMTGVDRSGRAAPPAGDLTRPGAGRSAA